MAALPGGWAAPTQGVSSAGAPGAAADGSAAAGSGAGAADGAGAPIACPPTVALMSTSAIMSSETWINGPMAGGGVPKGEILNVVRASPTIVSGVRLAVVS